MPGDAVAGTAVGTTYRRTVAFIETSGDSSMFVPWEFVNRVESDGIHRFARGWLGRAGEWRLFVNEDWTTELARAPWRIVPSTSARLVVGLDDALREIYFQEGLRDLSVRLGEVAVEWSGQSGETYRLLTGTTRLAGVETAGLVLDAFTARDSDAAQRAELALLSDGDRLQLLLANREGPVPHRAWARLGPVVHAWNEVELVWHETRAFERARRELPVVWRIAAENPALEGEFEAVSSHQHTLSAAGALLPVWGVYEVSGHVTIEGERFDVKGFLRNFLR